MVGDPELVRRDLRAASAGLAAAGVDLEAVARHAGFPRRPDQLRPEEWGAQPFHQLWVGVLALTGDVTIPLSAGDAVPFGAYEIIDYLGSSCASIGAGLEQMARYFALITPTLEWTVDGASDPPLVRLTTHHIDLHTAAVATQYALGVTFGRFRRLCVGEFTFASVDLALPEPPDRRRHVAFFGDAPVRYAAPTTVVRLPRRVWTLPMARGEPGLMRVLERHAEALLAQEREARDPLLELRRAIRERLAAGEVKVEPIARALGTSTRTLQRRLGASATTFQAVVDEERRRAAQTYLREQRLAVSDVAYLLGYSEPSAFVRAFKRWTGVTPRAFRNQALGL